MKKRGFALSVLLLLAGLGWSQDIATWKAQAAEGNIGAQYNLGLAYSQGLGLAPDPKEAARWFRLAADQGFAPAAASLGLMYFKGEGVPVDHAEAVRLFRIGAEGGDAFAQLCMGISYANGDQVPQDPAESARWMRLSAIQGNPSAQLNLGNALAAGNGVSVSYAEAGAWWYAAALQGHPKAKANLSNLGLWRKVATKGDPGIQCWLGFSQLLNGDGKAGFTTLVKAAEGGYVHAQAMLGAAYYEGSLPGYTLKKDLAESARWCRLAAEQGDAASQYNLGMAYVQGEGVDKDPTQALAWLLKAASQHYVDAYYNLGAGLLMAAQQENSDAGLRAEILVKAYMFMSLAGDKDKTEEGRAQARDALAKIAIKMTPDQVAEGQRQASFYGR